MSKDRVSRWVMWTENPCFFEMEQMVRDIIKDSIDREDSVSTVDLTVAIVAESRGIRKGLDELMRRIDEERRQRI